MLNNYNNIISCLVLALFIGLFVLISDIIEIFSSLVLIIVKCIPFWVASLHRIYYVYYLRFWGINKDFFTKKCQYVTDSKQLLKIKFIFENIYKSMHFI